MPCIAREFTQDIRVVSCESSSDVWAGCHIVCVRRVSSENGRPLRKKQRLFPGVFRAIFAGDEKGILRGGNSGKMIRIDLGQQMKIDLDQ